MKYTEKDMTIMEGLEHIRHRPAMYAGSTDSAGLQFVVDEIVKWLIKTGRQVAVDGYRISAWGEPLSVETHPKVNKPIAEILCTVMGTGTAFCDSGAMLAVLNALSESMTLETRGGPNGARNYIFSFAKGYVKEPMKVDFEINEADIVITFVPDKQIWNLE